MKRKTEIDAEIIKLYVQGIGNKKLMNQFRKEHPKYYWRARRFFHQRENLEDLHKLQNAAFHKKRLVKTRAFRRLHRLKTADGQVLSGLNKREYTNYCEICGKLQPMKLHYHHWNKNNPNMGMWICFSCHHFAEACDKGYTETYEQKKKQIEIAGIREE